MKSLLWKRTLCCLLSMILILGNLPVFSFAEESDGLCEHHTVHTSECGYSPAIPGSPCTHEHTQDCYQTVAECIHVHDDACGYNEEAGDASCAHVCSEEYGCFKLVPDCRHDHDESCGYVEATPEQPCTYSCTECAEPGEDPSEPEEDPSEPEVDEAVEAVRALIEALPTLEEIKAMSMEEQSEVYKQVQEAYNAYNALTDDQKAQLPEAEGIFAPLFEYFNSLTAPAEATASGTCGTYLTWVLEDGTLTISGSGNMYDFSMSGATGWSQYSSQITKIVVESGVTTIGAYAFGSLKNLENVEIASTVQSIGKYAFSNCSNLHSVNIPNGITEIQERTFLNCSSLAYVSIPNTVTVIRASAFLSCSSLSEVDIPDSVTTIEQDSFSYSGLMSVTLPGNLSTITLRSFNSCEKLQSVIIPSSVKTIENKAFNYSTNMTDVYYEGSEADWNDISIGTDNAVLLDATIHFNWKCVDGHQFSDGVCTVCGIKGGYCGLQGENLIWILDDEGNLTISGEGEMEDYYGINAPWGHGIVSIVIESGATSIGYRAFEDCSMLASAILPNGITEIRAWAFEGCEALTQITIPESVTTVGMWAFGLSGLTSVTIPLNVTKIEDYTFGGCQSLASVTIPEGVTSIGREAFSNCPKLAELSLPSNLTSIGTSAFESCLSLQTVTIPENVASIGGNAFGNAFPDKIPQLTTIRFRGHGFLYTSNDPLVASSVTAYYPAGDNTWTQEVRDSFVGPITWVAAECPVNGTHTAVTDAGYSASCTQDGLTDGSHCSACGAVLVEQTVIPAGHTFVNGVCSECGAITGSCGANGDNLAYVLTTDGVLTISGSGKMAYYSQRAPAPWYSECTKITSVVLTDGVTSIGNYAFYGCSNLTSVTIPEGVTSIGFYAFEGCSSLTSITIPDRVTSIGSFAFSGCSGLTSVTIPDGVTSIGSAAFKNCTGLTTVQFLGDGFTGTADIFNNPVTAYYPHGNTTWTQEIRDSFGNYVTWAEACTNGTTHTEVIDPAVEPTCTKPGLTKGSHCSVCGTVLVAQEEIPPTSHTEETIPGKAATCTETGLTDGKKCSVCGRILKKQAVIPAGHRFDESNKCTVCGVIGGKWGDQGTWELVDGCLTIQGAAMFDQLCPALSDAPWGIYSEDIRKIVIGNNVGICENAFANLANLEAVTIAAIDGIRDNAFAGCGNLNTITFTEDVPFAISQTAFTGVTATAHYNVEYNTRLYINLQNYGGSLTWVEHGDNAKRIEIILYGSSGGVGSFVVQTYPNKTTADCEFTLSAEGVIELTSQYFRGATFRELSPGEVTVTARDKSTGLTASCTIFVADTQPKDIDCPYEEEILIDGTIIRREYRFIPQTTGYYASYNSYMGEAGGITVTQGDSWVDRVSSQYIPSDGEYGVYYLTAGETYSISLECDSWYYGTYATFRWTQPETQVTSVFFEEEEFHFDLAPGTQDQSAWASAYVTPGECLGKLTWSIGDSTVAEIQSSDGNNCCLTLKKAGTTTLTASCGDKSASVPLVVHSPVELKLNQTAQLNHYKNTYNRMVQFTAEEDGQYVFTVQGASSVSIDGQMQYPNGYGTDGNTYFTKVSAGQTVVLRLGLHEDSSAAVSVAKAESKPDSMELICLSNNQHKVSFGVSFSPATSMDKIVSWTVSDPDLLGELSTYDSSNSKQSYIPYAKGEVTVTATSASGLTASCTLTVGRCFDGHTNVPQVIAPTCTTGGFTIHTCSVCGEKTITSRVDALGHDLTHHDAQAATCTEDGWNTYDDCSRCDYTTYEEIPATGHTLSHVDSTPATCKKEGVEEHFHCDLCGKDFEDENGTTEMTDTSIPAKDHTEETISGKAATCTEDGLTDGKKCSVCGEILEKQQTIPAGHTFVNGVCSGCGAITGSCGADGDNLTYILTTDGVLTISGSWNMAHYSKSSPAPWYSERTKITSVVLMDGVTSIGERAFSGCSGLTSVTIPEGVTAIEQDAFKGCTALTSVTIPKGVTSIGYDAFEDCSSLTSVTIPEGVTAIRSGAFSGCSSLTSVTIPEGVTSIESSTFSGCSGLTSVTIPEGVTSIGDYTFCDCSSLTSVTIPDGVTSIGDRAFYGCSGLTSVTIPNSVTSIGYWAFTNCSSLTSVTIPDGVTSIGSWAFGGCSGLTSVTIPDSVTTIGNGAFSDCSNLTSVAIPDGVTSIGSSAFHGCSGLTSVTIPNSVTSIGYWAFTNCSSLTSVTIPDGVTSIGSWAFGGCSGLTSVIIPEGVTSIGEEAFADCYNLKTVRFLGDGVPGDDTIFTSPVIAYYPNGNTTWTQEIRDSYGSLVTWVEEGAERLLELAGTGLENEQVVWIDGVAVPVQKDGSGNPYVTLPENSSSILVTYSFNTGSGDRHTQYPTGMKVYRIVETENGPTVEHLPQLDNLLQYSGCSIRIVGVKGIRMITSISKSTRSSLMGDGLAGFKLVEYGTALCRASALEGGAPMVLGTPGVKSNYAYKRGVADPIFKDTGSLIQYTNVLVGFSDEDCKEDIAMRPYIVLEDENGETVTIYGGTVYRSIGYIAYQNRSAFAPGTAAYDYVWNIIHYVYGDQYDADYKG